MNPTFRHPIAIRHREQLDIPVGREFDSLAGQVQAALRNLAAVVPTDLADLAGDLTAGSIPYADADGHLTEDNARLVWSASLGTLLVTRIVLAANSVATYPHVGGAIVDHYVDANNGTTVETDLYSDSLAGGTLGVNGDKILAQYGGVFAGSATSTQTLRVYFGGTKIFDSGALAIGAVTDSFDLYISVIRVSATVVRCTVSVTTNFATLNASATYTEVTGLTLANSQILKITGQAGGVGGGSNQITAKHGYVEWLPSAA